MACTCRKWDISGIPCKHAVSAIFNQNEMPEDYVHDYYTVDMYKKAYAPVIMGISGEMLWEHSLFIPPLPPNFGRGPGPAGLEEITHEVISGAETVEGMQQVRKVSRSSKLSVNKTLKKKPEVSMISKKSKVQDEGNQASMNDTNETEIENVVSAPPTTLPDEIEVPSQQQGLDIIASQQSQVLPTTGPSMFTQLQMSIPSLQTQSQQVLQTRLNIRAPPPIIGAVPSFSKRRASMTEGENP
ncbi:UNVERIFIED_CONTAM: hypothetical protein Sradi_4552500 [Sesamum radiatum]|uniref:SWIM-type domain-containing protein n=1 Tax=Sesamum radiatum TaxID=300843 RepID=A0AAW2NA34_SESRA